MQEVIAEHLMLVMLRGCGLSVTAEENEPELLLALRRVAYDRKLEADSQTHVMTHEMRWNLLLASAADEKGTPDAEMAALTDQRDQVDWMDRRLRELEDKLKSAKPLTPGTMHNIISKEKNPYFNTTKMHALVRPIYCPLFAFCSVYSMRIRISFIFFFWASLYSVRCSRRPDSGKSAQTMIFLMPTRRRLRSRTC
jgi:hypothetical protein